MSCPQHEIARTPEGVNQIGFRRTADRKYEPVANCSQCKQILTVDQIKEIVVRYQAEAE